eukprot:m.39683 g.39683  ORF g.39683 m.39683 type:complete len:223 (-) comp10341_c0_seq1:117-785(-)
MAWLDSIKNVAGSLGSSSNGQTTSMSSSSSSASSSASSNAASPGVEGAVSQDEQQLSSWFGSGEQEEGGWCPTLTKTQRVLMFMGCLCGAIFCLALAYLVAPFILIKARKFSLLFSLGSLLLLGSFAALRGPYTFFKHLITGRKALITVAYLVSLFATLYCAMYLRRVIPTVICASAELACMASIVGSYVPGGLYGLKLLLKLSWATTQKVVFPAVKAVLPI